MWWGDAAAKFQEVAAKYGPIELLFLDGVPKETLAYLQAAEPYLAPGAMVVADNAGGQAASSTLYGVCASHALYGNIQWITGPCGLCTMCQSACIPQP